MQLATTDYRITDEILDTLDLPPQLRILKQYKYDQVDVI